VFDADGRVTGITNPLDTFTYAYADATPRVSGVTSAHGPNLAVTYFGPKGDELVQQMAFTTQSGGSLSQFGYTYNADDNVVSFTESYLNQKFAQLTGAGGGQSSGNSALASVLAGVARSPGHAAGSGPPGYGFSRADTVLLLAAVLLAGLGFIAYRGGRRWRFLWAALPAATAALLASCSHGGSHPSGGGGSGGGTGTTPPPPPPSPTAQVTAYGYDAASRLTSALLGTNVSSSSDSTTPQYAYAYDAASNITSIAANAAPQSISYTATNSISSGTYDTNGNPTTLGSTSYTWDAANRVLSYVSGTNESDFTYDGFSHLVRVVDKQNGSVVADKAYLWCGQSRCLQHDNTQTGSPVTKQYFTQGVLVGSTAYYYVTDVLGSIRQLVDASGNVQAQYDYDPYGNASKISGSVDSDIGYAGYFRHAASGLLFALYRAYDPAHARWLNRDPAGEAAGVNLYAYVYGNPVSYLDPTGNFGVVGALIGGGLGALLDVAYQLYNNGGNFSCINLTQVAVAAGAGAVIGSGAEFLYGLLATEGELGAPVSAYINTTADGAKVLNITTDVTAEEAGATLESNGFTASASSDGEATIYTNAQGDTYVIRPSNSAPGGQAMDYYPNNGGQPIKINFGGPPYEP
jgi:RHS repeat-associated protein